MRESKIERYLHQQVEARGGTTRKFKSPNRRNVPDRIVIWPGNVVHFVECKAPNKDARPGQQREHERLRFFGCVVCVLDTIDSVDNYVRHHA